MNPEGASHQTPDDAGREDQSKASIPGNGPDTFENLARPEPLERLTPELIHKIHATHAADFVRDGEELLRDVTHFVDMAGAWHWQFIVPVHRQSPFLERGTELHERLKALVPAGVSLMDEIAPHLAAPDSTELSVLVTTKLYPFLSELKNLIRTTTVLKRDVAEKWLENPELSPREQVARDERFHLQERNLQVNTRIAQLFRGLAPFDEASPEGPTVVKALIFPPRSNYVRYEGLAHGFEFPKEGLTVQVPQADLLFAVRQSYLALRRAIDEVNDSAAGYFKEAARLAAIKPEDFRLSKEAALLEHLYLAEHDPDVKILDDGAVKFSYSFSPVVSELWKEKLPELQNRLQDVSAVCRAYDGSLSCSLCDEPPGIVVKLNFPVGAQNSESAASSPYVINGLRKPHVIGDSPASRGISLAQRAGDKEYMVGFLAAGILSADGFRQLKKVLEQTDRLIGIFPHFDAVSVRVIDSHREDTQERFEQGLIALDFSQAHKEWPADESRKHLLERASRLFEWEMTPRQWDRELEKYSAKHDDPAAEFNSRHFSLGAGLIFDDALKEIITKLNAKATFIQLSLEHPDLHEARALPRFNSLVKSFVVELDKMIDKARAELGVEHPKVRVGCYVRLRVSDAGKSDRLFFVELFDEKNREVGRGDFHKDDATLRYKLHDATLVAGVLRRMGNFINLICDNPKRSFRELDRSLADDGVELPEDVILQLKEQIRQGAPPEAVAEVLEHFLRQPFTSVETSGDKVRISADLGNPQFSGPAYGVITQATGNNPEEICDFEMARTLHEEGCPYFHPSQRFFNEYGVQE